MHRLSQDTRRKSRLLSPSFPTLRALLFVGTILSLHGIAISETLTLEQCVEVALRKNRDILAVRERMIEKKGALISDRSERLPQISVESSYDREYYDTEDSTWTDYSSHLRASQELFRYGQTPSQTFTLRQEYRKARYDYLKTMEQAISDVRKAFFSVLLTEEEIAARGEMLMEFEEKYNRMKQRYEAGKVRPIDVKEAKLEVLDERLRINDLKRNLRSQKSNLLKVIGMLGAWTPDQLQLVGSIPEGDFKEVSEDSLKAMVQKALENRAEIAELASAVEEQRKQLHGTYWGWFPNLTGTASYRHERTEFNLQITQTGKLWRSALFIDHPLYEKHSDPLVRDGDWRVGLALNIPIFKGLENWGLYRRESAKLKSLEYELEKKRNQVELEVRDAFYKVLSAEERLAIQKERVQITKERLEIIESLIEFEWARYITYEDILRRRQDFNQARNNYFATRQSYVMAMEDLRKAIGTR